VVLHPLIDAVITLRNRERIDPAAVREIRLKAHPFVPAITDVVDPATGLQSKFSTLHSAAVALVDGAAGIAQFSDARSRDPLVAALRAKVTVVADPSLGKDEAYAAILVADRLHEAHIPHASGTAGNPMSDAAIEVKFLANATPVIGAQRARSVCDRVWSLEHEADMRALIALVA
jgi:2-methylcitrate dehydratase PrpD